MFVKTLNAVVPGDTTMITPFSPLAFVKSLDIQAYPCGRRRSQKIVNNAENYNIPFDPEARLNTEANNRKHSGLNGLASDYINKFSSDEGILSLVLAGYLFDIKLAKNMTLTDTICNALITEFKTLASSSGTETAPTATSIITSADRIYANILIEETQLYTGEFKEYFTGVLRDQSAAESSDNSAKTELDLVIDEKANLQSAENYYFSGLSFSIHPLTGIKPKDQYIDSQTISPVTRDERKIYSNGALVQRIVSLCIFEKKNGSWQIHKPACLPEIKHGDLDGSIKLGDTCAQSFRMGTDSSNSKSVPAIQLKKDGNEYQLQFFNVDKLTN